MNKLYRVFNSRRGKWYAAASEKEAVELAKKDGNFLRKKPKAVEDQTEDYIDRGNLKDLLESGVKGVVNCTIQTHTFPQVVEAMQADQPINRMPPTWSVTELDD